MTSHEIAILVKLIDERFDVAREQMDGLRGQVDGLRGQVGEMRADLQRLRNENTADHQRTAKRFGEVSRKFEEINEPRERRQWAAGIAARVVAGLTAIAALVATGLGLTDRL